MRTYKVVIGSRRYFENSLTDEELHYNSFLERVRIVDAVKSKPELLDSLRMDNLRVENNHYQGIVEEAHGRLGSLIEDMTTENATIVVHNPTRVLHLFLQQKYSRGEIYYSEDKEQLPKLQDGEELRKSLENIKQHIIGQDEALAEIVKSIWYIANSSLSSPYVIMLYGESSIGKTETVREISKAFFDDKCLEEHLSMYHGLEYAEFLFGSKPNRRSLGFELFERESNLLFLDEFDKCPEYCLSAFYTLFDNTVFKDASYDVDISNLLIVLTSNFRSEDEIKRSLGDPIFYRINKLVHYAPLSKNAIHEIAIKNCKEVSEELGGAVSCEALYSDASRLISTSGENGRTIRMKIEGIAEERLLEKLEINSPATNPTSQRDA